MTDDPTTLDEALRLRREHDDAGHIKLARELSELIVERWPESPAAAEVQSELEAAQAESGEPAATPAAEISLPFPTGPAQKAVATKRKDQGFGLCRRRGCTRPAAERGGECKEHAAGTKMVETKRRKGLID